MTNFRWNIETLFYNLAVRYIFMQAMILKCDFQLQNYKITIYVISNLIKITCFVQKYLENNLVDKQKVRNSRCPQ